MCYGRAVIRNWMSSLSHHFCQTLLHWDWVVAQVAGFESQSSKRSELVDVLGLAEGHTLLQSWNGKNQMTIIS